MITYWHKYLSNISPLAIIGDESIIHAGVHIHDYVSIGKRCKIQAGVFIPQGVTIEDDVFVGPMVCFTNDPNFKESFTPIFTLVKRGAKIGAHSTIKAGITIGEHAIIGQHSNVLCNVPTGETWVGNPARKLYVKSKSIKRYKIQRRSIGKSRRKT